MWCLKYTILFCIDIKLWTEVSYAKSPFPCSSLWFAWTPYNWHGKEEMLLSQVPVRCDIQFSRTAALLGAKNVFCMHPYFNYFSPFFFFLSNPYISSLLPSRFSATFYVPTHLHLLSSFLNKWCFFPLLCNRSYNLFLLALFFGFFFFHLGYLQMENRL